MPKSRIGGVSRAMTFRANGLEIVICVAPRMLLWVPGHRIVLAVSCRPV